MNRANCLGRHTSTVAYQQPKADTASPTTSPFSAPTRSRSFLVPCTTSIRSSLPDPRLNERAPPVRHRSSLRSSDRIDHVRTRMGLQRSSGRPHRSRACSRSGAADGPGGAGLVMSSDVWAWVAVAPGSSRCVDLEQRSLRIVERRWEVLPDDPIAASERRLELGVGEPPSRMAFEVTAGVESRGRSRMHPQVLRLKGPPHR